MSNYPKLTYSCHAKASQEAALTLAAQLKTLKWTPNLRQVFKWDTVQRNG